LGAAEPAAAREARVSATRSVRALIVEDNPDDEALVVAEIRRGGYHVIYERVQSADAMRAALARGSWDIVLSDYAMPSFSAPAALELLHASGLDIPFIIVSGTVGEETAVAAMRSGASDYVLKDNLTRLCPAIERELRESARRIEQRHMREQLLISDRMASVGTLAAGVAHEINNPLAAICANIELAGEALGTLAREPGRPELAGRLDEILDELRDARDAAERVRHIIRDLRIFSRAPDEERRGPVDVRQVLESSVRMAWNEIRHRAKLIKEYGDVPPVEANEARLGQVFLNLVVNAAQAIPEGDAAHNTVRVTTKVDGDRVLVEVRDTGAGIAPEHLPRIFDAFFTTKPMGVGTGLGLSICHRIVQGLGGEIHIDSAPGRGTTVSVSLPPAPDDAAAVAEPPARPVAASRRGRVLIVDDEPSFAKAVARHLRLEHDVELTGSAGEALRRVRQGERFDVILCDLMMPQMTGMELHAELVRLAPELAGRMVFVTGGAFTPGARAFLDNIPNQRLEKPFDAQQLRAVLNDRIR
jgi:signal transduction histidine kinase